MPFPNKVKIVEVGPRDGLQNEKRNIPTRTKIEFINRLSETGLKTIEVTSFVSPKWIPQLADGAKVFSSIQKVSGIHYPVLVPNARGMQSALEAGVKEVAVFSAASETFSKKNTNCTIAESFERIKEIARIAEQHHTPMRGYISCVLGCPYEGDISIDAVLKVALQLRKLGCSEISLGDTIGVGTPNKARLLIDTISRYIPIETLAVHFHDTFGQALANIYACLELGISTIDSSIAGLGGCPYAKGASGNVATEDVVYMLKGLNIHTGVNLETLLEVSKFVTEFTGHPPRSKVAQARIGKSE